MAENERESGSGRVLDADLMVELVVRARRAAVTAPGSGDMAVSAFAGALIDALRELKSARVETPSPVLLVARDAVTILAELRSGESWTERQASRVRGALALARAVFQPDDEATGPAEVRKLYAETLAEVKGKGETKPAASSWSVDLPASGEKQEPLRQAHASVDRKGRVTAHPDRFKKLKIERVDTTTGKVIPDPSDVP